MIEFPITLTSGGSVCLPGRAYALALGYTKNRGVYRLAVTASGEWEGLAIRCFWHVPDGKDPASSLVDGYVDVPASVTAQPGSGCITFEGSDGAKVMTSADLRYRVSANSGTEDGTEPEPGTPAWQQLVDAVHADATAAEQAKTDAQTAAQLSPVLLQVMPMHQPKMLRVHKLQHLNSQDRQRTARLKLKTVPLRLLRANRPPKAMQQLHKGAPQRPMPPLLQLFRDNSARRRQRPVPKPHSSRLKVPALTRWIKSALQKLMP